MGFSRQAYWSGSPFPFPRDLPDPWIEPSSPALAGGFFTIWASWGVLSSELSGSQLSHETSNSPGDMSMGTTVMGSSYANKTMSSPVTWCLFWPGTLTCHNWKTDFGHVEANSKSQLLSCCRVKLQLHLGLLSFFFLMSFYFWLCWVFHALRRLSLLLGQVGATLCCGAWASHCCGAQAVIAGASVVATLRFSGCGSWA